MSLKKEREEKEILRILSSLITFEVKDKLIKRVTLTEVRLTSDLKQAKVFYTTEDDRALVQKEFERAANFLRYELTTRLNVKNSPELVFAYDTSIENAEHIEKIIEGLK